MRIIGKNTKPKEAFPKTFIIVRLILLVPVSMAMFSSLEWYGQQLNLHNVPGVSFSENSGGIVDEQVAKVGLGIIEAELQKENLSDQQYKDLMTAKQKLQENFDYNTNQSLTESTSIPKDELVNNEESKENEAGSEQTNKEAIEIFFLDGVTIYRAGKNDGSGQNLVLQHPAAEPNGAAWFRHGHAVNVGLNPVLTLALALHANLCVRTVF